MKDRPVYLISKNVCTLLEYSDLEFDCDQEAIKKLHLAIIASNGTENLHLKESEMTLKP